MIDLVYLFSIYFIKCSRYIYFFTNLVVIWFLINEYRYNHIIVDEIVKNIYYMNKYLDMIFT